MAELIIPKNATIRQEYVSCGKYDCTIKHGPYYYAYWKENGKLKKRYIGKDYVDGYVRVAMTRSGDIDRDLTWTKFKKAEFIHKQAEKGNKLAQEYDLKCDAGRVSIDWAYKQVKEGLYVQHYFKMARIATKKGFKCETENELFDFISKDMKSKGLDVDNDDDLDSYLNTEVM